METRAYNRIKESPSNLGIVNPNDADFKNLYSTQDWISDESVILSRDLIYFALNTGILKFNEIFTIEKQKASFELYGKREYLPPYAIPFVRRDSRGDYVQCYAIEDGHHRIYTARRLGIPIQMQLDLRFGIIDTGQPRSLIELNEILAKATYGAVGNNANSLRLGRNIYRDICFCLDRQEP